MTTADLVETRVADGLSPLLQPIVLRNLTIRNRMVSTAHNSRYGEGGLPTERYQSYSEEKARGGIGLIVFGGGGSVAPESKGSSYQLSIYDERIIPHLKRFSARVHAQGAAIMCQLAHMGRKTKWSAADWMPPAAPSLTRERNHRSFPKVLEEHEIRRIIEAFAQSAVNCQEGGLDGVEVAAHAQQLVDQFLSPQTNKRVDQWGGSLENRMRFAREVLSAIRRRCGDDFVIGLRLVGDERLEDGLSPEECGEIARLLSEEGLVDFLNVTAGQLYNHMNRARYSPGMWSAMGPYLGVAHAIKQHVRVPVMHAARIHDPAVGAKAIEDGLIDMVGLTRAYIADPHLGRKIYEGRSAEIRPCVGANYCLDRLFLGGEALCIHNAATGREQTIPHKVPPAAKIRRVLVVGAGPAGLEAARVCAERGHQVVVFEKNREAGGQIRVAAGAPWRGELLGIVSWRLAELRRLGVTLRFETEASPADIAASDADIVILATGGLPHKGDFAGADLAISTSEALALTVSEGTRVVVYDDHGGAQAASAAEHLATQGASVHIVTPDRAFGEEMGPNNWAVFKRNLYRRQARITTDHRLDALERASNRLQVTLANEYSEERIVEEADHVIAENGTRPSEALYNALVAASRNGGRIDLFALKACEPQPDWPGEGFALYRVGDAVASRDIHAAIYDSTRLCLTL